MGKSALIYLYAICCLIVTLQTAAESKSNKATTLPVICNKTAVELDGGLRFGKFIGRNTKPAYLGPSVLCHITEQVTTDSDFIVLGSSKSTFGKSWFYIHLLKSGRKLWIPTKYVSLGERVKTDVPAKEITPRLLTSTKDLNVRACPQTYCKIVGTASTAKQYQASKQADNGWLYIKVNGTTYGWVSNKYMEKSAAKVSTTTPDIPITATSTQNATYIPPKVVKPETTSIPKPKLKSKPKFDPCSYKEKYTGYKKRKLWHVQIPINLKRVPHLQCGQEISLEKGKVVVPIGETELFYVLATVPHSKTEVGYFYKTHFKEQYVPKQELYDKADIYSTAVAKYILDKEAYWNSYRYVFDSSWWELKGWVHLNTGRAISIFAFLLGSLLLIPKYSRRILFRVDQVLLRSGYFFVRSREFWRMLRRLAFILIVTTCILLALIFYVLWLKNVATYVEMAMGMGSLALMSLSIGWFGARVASFFTGLLLFFFSLFQFISFVIFVCFLFLLPSLLLLLRYYWFYHKNKKGGHNESTVFDHEEVERIHEKVFRLRNFYPETVVSWVRSEGLRDRWNSLKEVTRAKSQVFDAFFKSVNHKASQA